MSLQAMFDWIFRNRDVISNGDVLFQGPICNMAYIYLDDSKRHAIYVPTVAVWAL